MAEVIEIDRGWKRIMRMLISSGRDFGHARVGFLEGALDAAGLTPEPEGDEPNTLTIAEIAFANEYGVPSKNIPARPFMQRTVAENREKYERMFALGMSDMLQGRMTRAQVLNEVGLEGQNDMRKMIDTSPSWAVPNAPITILRKGSSKPLIDTGAMRMAITYDVVIEGR